MYNTCSELYLLQNHNITASPCENGLFVDTYYLEGRTAMQLKLMAPALSDDMAQTFVSQYGLHSLAAGIRVSITARGSKETKETAVFSLMTNPGSEPESMEPSCRHYSANVPLNGEAVTITLSNSSCLSEKESPLLSCIQVTFPYYMNAVISVSLQLREPLSLPFMPPETEVDTASSAYKEMICRSLLHSGNLARLQKAIKKAQKGEEVTLAYIGGSITQGAGAKPIHTMCYAKKSCEAFKQRFALSPDKVHYIKAGVGGTPSQLGIARYQRDILDHAGPYPDIVVIEFAVNDYDDETKGICYESLSLMAYEGPGSPAVILLFSVFADDENLQERLSRIGYHYDFPMVSVKDAVMPEYSLENPLLTRRQYFHDIYHPGNLGHQIMADSLDHLWYTASVSEAAAEKPLPSAPVIGDTYKHLKAFTRADVSSHPAVISLDPGSFTATDTDLQSVERDDDLHMTLQFPVNWMHMGTEASAFTLSIFCKSLLLIYKDTGNRQFAQADIFIDNVLARTIDPCALGWNHCGTAFLLNTEESAHHTIEIKPRITPFQTQFSILGFGYT